MDPKWKFHGKTWFSQKVNDFGSKKSVFSVFFLVPCIGPIVASFATIVSVVCATITLEEMKQEAKAAVQ